MVAAALPLAEQLLASNGAFYPFGNTMGRDGKIASVAASTGSEHPDSTDLIQILKGGFIAGARRGEFRATSLVYNIRTIVPDTGIKSDAVAMACDHEAGFAAITVFPYRITKSEVIFGKVFAQRIDSVIFQRTPDPDGVAPAPQR